MIISRESRKSRKIIHRYRLYVTSGRLTRASQAFSVYSASLREKTENLCVRVCFVVNIYLTRRTQRRTCSAVLSIRQANASIASVLCVLCALCVR